MGNRIGDRGEPQPTVLELAVAVIIAAALVIVFFATAHNADRGIPNDDRPTTQEGTP